MFTLVKVVVLSKHSSEGVGNGETIPGWRLAVLRRTPSITSSCLYDVSIGTSEVNITAHCTYSYLFVWLGVLFICLIGGFIYLFDWVFYAQSKNTSLIKRRTASSLKETGQFTGGYTPYHRQVAERPSTIQPGRKLPWAHSDRTRERLHCCCAAVAR